MESLIDKILHRMIHKTMLGDPALACKNRTGDADPKMAAETFRICTRVPCMGSAFVDHFEMRGLQALSQLTGNVFRMNRQWGG